MATDTCDVQGQPDSATVRETPIVLDPVRDGSDRRLATRESVKDSHACDVNHKPADRSAETEPNDTTLISQPISCKSKSVEKTRTSITRDLSSRTDLFYQVIESYQKYAKRHHLPPDFDIRKAHNWDEVHQAARLAETKYKNDGTRSIFSKIGRGIQRSTPAVEPWLELIPDGNYTSVLCGGLKIAFGVAGHIHEQGEQIFEMFQQIPETIMLAEDRLQEWPDDETLHDAAIELYLAALESIEAMIIWLVDKSTRKRIWQLLMKPKTKKLNNFGLDVIQKEIKRLQDRATTLQSKAIVRTDANVEKTGAVVDIIKITTQSIERIMIEEIRPAITETRNLVRETRWRTDVHAKALRSGDQPNGLVTPKPETHVEPRGAYLIFGYYGEFDERIVGKLREELIGPMAKVTRRLNTVSPELWALEDYPLEMALDVFDNEALNALRAIKARPVEYTIQSMRSSRTMNYIMMILEWIPQAEGLKGEDALRLGVPLTERLSNLEHLVHASQPNGIPESKRQDLFKSKL